MTNLGEVAVAAAGMVVFALCAHRPAPLAIVSGLGLLAAALGIGRGVLSAPSPGRMLGFRLASRQVAAFTILGLIIGIGLGLAYRAGYGWELLPRVLRPFALVSVAIGVTEELIYRGYVQGRLRGLGPVGAVACAALCHTAYKAALFAFPPFPLEINWVFLVGATFAAGLAFGALRAVPGSVLPPVAAHALFDLIVYGGRAHAPWWVWS